MEATNTENATGSMPIPMAVDPRLSPEAVALGQAVSEEDESKSKDREFFKKRIHYWWNKTIEGILETGWCLVEAQAALPSDEWSKFVKNDVPLDYSAMRKLMGVAQDHRISDPKYADLLPASWTSLHEISLMDNETFERAMAQGLIHRSVTLKELKLLRSKEKKTKTPKPGPAPNVGAPSAPTETDQAGPETKKAVVKAPLNNSGLHAVEKVPVEPMTDVITTIASTATASAAAVAPAIATTVAKGRIAIVLSKDFADQHKADVADLIEEIEAVVKDYDFIGGIELEVAA